MLRLVAFIADVDLRKIVNWQRRRIAARLAIALPGSAVIVVLIALFPITAWGTLQLGDPRFPYADETAVVAPA
jgi:hypothetical protein